MEFLSLLKMVLGSDGVSDPSGDFFLALDLPLARANPSACSHS